MPSNKFSGWEESHKHGRGRKEGKPPLCRPEEVALLPTL